MSDTIPRILVCVVCLLGFIQEGRSWKEQTHEEHLTPLALELMKLEAGANEKQNTGKYDPEIWDHRDFILWGAHDEDLPCDLSTKAIPNSALPCRANNHYFHPIDPKSRIGLSDAPWAGLGDRDLDALSWAKSNGSFSAEEEFQEGKDWKGFRFLTEDFGWTARDLTHGKMSWFEAIDRYGYTQSSKVLAYYMLGFILHLLQDMSVPEHVHDDPHGASGFTGFEKWVYKNWPEMSWEDEIKKKARKLAPRNYDTIDDFFINLARIAYSSNRFQGGDLKPGQPCLDPGSDLARMFSVEYAPVVDDSDPVTDNIDSPMAIAELAKDGTQRRPQWVLRNHPDPTFRETPEIMQTSLNMNAKWCPSFYEANPLGAKGHDLGEWWPTSKEVPGGRNDEPGYFYIELSGDFPVEVIEPIRNFYPKAYLPTPLRSVTDQCQQWRKEESEIASGEHLYTLIGKTVMPYAVRYSADLIRHYYDIVNPPPYVAEIEVKQENGHSNYSARWVDIVERCRGKDNIDCVKARTLETRANDAVQPGEVEIRITFSEPVTVKEVKWGDHVLTGGRAGERDTVWSTVHLVEDEGPNTEEATLSIRAVDKNNHYQGILYRDVGGSLDIEPATPARRLAKSGVYAWSFYEYEPDADTQHTVRIDRGKLTSVLVEPESGEIDPCDPIVFEAREGVYEFGSGERKTLPLRRKDVEALEWSWEGPHTVLDPKQQIWEEQPERKLLGAASIVRGDQPQSRVVGNATIGTVVGEAVVAVVTTPDTSPFLQIEDVSSESAVEVGQSFQNRAVQFYCEDTYNPGYRPTTDVHWESDAPRILDCSPDGWCTGETAGSANVSLFHAKDGQRGAFITSRPVKVYGGAEASEVVSDLPHSSGECTALREEYFNKFGEMVQAYQNRSCEMVDQRAGCHQNVAGFIGAYIGDAFIDRYCEVPGYVECGVQNLEEYYACLVDCNERWQVDIRTPSGLRSCQGQCNQVAGAGRRRCVDLADAGANGTEQQPRSCRELGRALSDASEHDDIELFRSLLSQAEDCVFYDEALLDLWDWEQEEACQEIDSELKAARDARDMDQFRSVLEKAYFCDFYDQARRFLRDWEQDVSRRGNCEELFTAFEAAFYDRDLERARSVLEGARNCSFYQRAQSLLQNWEGGSMRAERCGKLLAELNDAYARRDVGRFRALLPYAEDCSFYQGALSDLAEMEGGRSLRPATGPIRGRCDEAKQEGSDRPETHLIDLGTTAGAFLFRFETFEKKDRIVVSYGGRRLFDTGCVGTHGWRSKRVRFSGFSSEVTVRVYPNCAGESDTRWKFVLECPR
jgi:hypothetical protein